MGTAKEKQAWGDEMQRMKLSAADPASLFNLRTAFDKLRPDRDAHIFASE